MRHGVSLSMSYLIRAAVVYIMRVMRCGYFHGSELEFDLESCREWELKWAAWELVHENGREWK